MDPTTTFYLGTERTAMNGLVPFLPVPQGRIGLRHAIIPLEEKIWPFFAIEYTLKPRFTVVIASNIH